MSFNLQNLADSLHQGLLLTVQLTTITYDNFIHLLEEANEICDQMPRGRNDEQVRFLTVKDLSKNVLWKPLIRIECQKVCHSDGTVLSSRVINLKQFIFLHRELKTLSSYDNRRSMSVFFDQNVEPLVTSTENADTGGSSTTVESTARGEEHSDSQSQPGASKVEKDKDECIICLERNSDLILPCTHAYCHKCISKWIAQEKRNTPYGSPEKQTCPVCRGEVPHGESDAWILMEAPDPDESREEMSQVLLQLMERTGKAQSQGKTTSSQTTTTTTTTSTNESS